MLRRVLVETVQCPILWPVDTRYTRMYSYRLYGLLIWYESSFSLVDLVFLFVFLLEKSFPALVTESEH